MSLEDYDKEVRYNQEMTKAHNQAAKHDEGFCYSCGKLSLLNKGLCGICLNFSSDREEKLDKPDK